MKVGNLPLNDEYTQYIKSLNTTSEDAMLKRKKMLSCQHLFVKLKERTSNLMDLNYNPVEIECVYCGLTNKHRLLEDFFIINQVASVPDKYRTIEGEVYKEVFKDNNPQDLFDFISTEVLETYHPRLLYQLAKIINSQAKQSELFEIMKELNAVETEQEKLRLMKCEQSSALLERYKRTTKAKTLTKSKQ